MRHGTTLVVAAILGLVWMPNGFAAPRKYRSTTEAGVEVSRNHNKVGGAYSGVTTALPNMKIQSTVWVQSPYSKGAAHPNTFFITKNFDPMSGQDIKLKDLFRPGSGWLKGLSKFSRNDLAKQMGVEATDDWLKRGTAAKPGNFTSWSVTKKGLQLYFSDYQVAPHAAGPQVVEVPWKDLKPFAKHDGPIGRMGEGKVAK